MRSSFWTELSTEERQIAKRDVVFAMPALHHMTFELERKHHSEFTRDKQTKVFDSDMVRVECRQEFGGKYPVLATI